MSADSRVVDVDFDGQGATVVECVSAQQSFVTYMASVVLLIILPVISVIVYKFLCYLKQLKQTYPKV